MMEIWGLGWALVLSVATLVWLLSLRLRDASIVDVFWGSGFVLLTAFYAWQNQTLSMPQWLHLGMVSLWGLRLSFHIFSRNHGHGEDRRYVAMRQRRGEQFWWISWFTIFALQATLMALISLPLMATQVTGVGGDPRWFWVGAALWLIGFLCEAVADRQLRVFADNPENAGRVLDTGLWRYSRHPNYFGEAVLWWGFGCCALATSWGPWTLLCPLFMTVLLLKVSGVVLLEKTIGSRRPGYRDYVARTSAFIPWFPKSAAAIAEGGRP